MRPAARRILLIGGAAAVLAIPALAQVQNNAAPATPPASNAIAPQPQPQAQPSPGAEAGVAVTQQPDARPPPPPVEYPGFARRDPFVAGVLDPARLKLGTAWGNANGGFLTGLLRRMDTPLASRWAHIGLRDALLASARSPGGVNPVDWAAERAWLLLRLGEADGARMLIATVDTDRFTPKMTQVAVQSALANSDPLGLCPLTDQMRRAEPRILPMVLAICSGLNGEPETAKAQIDAARRRGSIGGIDLALAQKVVGATTDTGTAATIEWDSVNALTAWRYGMATATALSPPTRLLDSASPQLLAWYARAPMIPFEDRLRSARLATGLGVFSSQALTDFYSSIYDSTDSNELAGTDSWQVRLAYAGRDEATRLGAMRRLWDLGGDRFQKEASRALLARAAARIPPNRDLKSDAVELIASMLAAGMDAEAARWANVASQLDDEQSDRAWAMLALGSPDGAAVDLGAGRVSAFVNRDTSPRRKRSALLIAGLTGLGRLDARVASRLNARYNLQIGRSTPWSQMIDAAARRHQGATVLLLSGTGLQAPGFESVPAAHLFHIVMALRNSDQQFLARMIAAEALART